MALTEEQRQKLISEGDGKCPYCGDDVESQGLMGRDGDGKYREWVQCDGCDMVWFNVYSLIDVEDGPET